MKGGNALRYRATPRLRGDDETTEVAVCGDRLRIGIFGWVRLPLKLIPEGRVESVGEIYTVAK
jgi:hypothetical protein